MAFIVSYWHCYENANWKRKPFDERLTELRAALFAANVETKMRNCGNKGFFVTHEYALADPEPQNPVLAMNKPAQHITVDQEQRVIAAMVAASLNYELIVCAGSMPVREPQIGNAPIRARNTCYAYRDGNLFWRVDKHHGVGEIGTDNTMVFVPGTGYAETNLNGRSYGVEICADASVGMLPNIVNLQFVVAASMMHGHARAWCDQFLIVADEAAHGVYDYRHSATGIPIEPYTTEKTLTTRMKYYRVP